jgi:ribose 5-phosphate isomerase
VVDARFGGIDDPAGLARALDSIPGVVGTAFVGPRRGWSAGRRRLADDRGVRTVR